MVEDFKQRAMLVAFLYPASEEWDRRSEPEEDPRFFPIVERNREGVYHLLRDRSPTIGRWQELFGVVSFCVLDLLDQTLSTNSLRVVSDQSETSFAVCLGRRRLLSYIRAVTPGYQHESEFTPPSILPNVVCLLRVLTCLVILGWLIYQCVINLW